MTDDINLLPLYAELQGHPKLEIIKHYTRANVAHATAAKDAEIERLREEVALLRHGNVAYAQQVADLIGRAGNAEARAERLVEALNDLLTQLEAVGIYIPGQDNGQWAGTEGLSFSAAESAALRNHDQEDEEMSESKQPADIDGPLECDCGPEGSYSCPVCGSAFPSNSRKPAAVGEVAELVGLLDEVRSHFTRDDDLPDDLLPRIDAALAQQPAAVDEEEMRLAYHAWFRSEQGKPHEDFWGFGWAVWKAALAAQKGGAA